MVYGVQVVCQSGLIIYLQVHSNGGVSLRYPPLDFPSIPHSSPRNTIVKLTRSVVDPDPLLFGLESGPRIMNYRSGTGSLPFIQDSMKFQKKVTEVLKIFKIY
jgi:hypothetical protein